MATFLRFFQAAVSIIVVLLILAQERGSGLSLTFGGIGNVYHSKRGAEKVIAIATVVFAILFVGCSIAFLFV